MKKRQHQAKCQNCEKYSSLVPIQEKHIIPDVAEKMQQGWQVTECSECGCPHFYAVNAQLRYFSSQLTFERYMRRNMLSLQFVPHTVKKLFTEDSKIQYTSLIW